MSNDHMNVLYELSPVWPCGKIFFMFGPEYVRGPPSSNSHFEFEVHWIICCTIPKTMGQPKLTISFFVFINDQTS